MSDTPVADPSVLAAFNVTPPPDKPVSDPDVMAAFGVPLWKRRLVQGGAYAEDPNTPEWQAKYGPLSGTSPTEQAFIGAGKFLTNRALGAKQAYAQATGSDPNAVTEPATGLNAEEKRHLDEPLSRPGWANVGEALAAAPAMFLPGANTAGGAAVLGGAIGATQPTVGNESRLINTGVGGALGAGSQALGKAVGSWATNRASEPFMGWNPTTADRAAAEAVGSDAPRLNQKALAIAHSRLSGIFSRARSPDVQIPVGDETLNALESAGSNLNASSRTAFYGSQQVKDLTAHLGANPNAEKLGTLSSQLGNEAKSQMTTKSGDRALGRSFFQLQDHVDDLVGKSITDPELQAAYTAARPQYRNYLMLTSSPQRLNSATGRFNATATGKYLQRADPAGYTRGGNESPLYEAARWGQASGEGPGAPPFSVENLGIPWAKYHATNNPVTQAASGAASRAIAPVAPALPRLAQALAASRMPQAARKAQELRALIPVGEQ